MLGVHMIEPANDIIVVLNEIKSELIKQRQILYFVLEKSTTNTEEEYLTVQKVAKKLSRSEETIRRWCRSNKIRGAFKLNQGENASFYIPKDSLEEMLIKQTN